MQVTSAIRSAEKKKRAASQRRKGRILVMDDDEYVRGIIRTALRENGYTVRTAMDGEEAIEKFLAAKEKGKPFTALVLDINVPEGMSGHEAFEKIRLIEPGIRAVLLTGDINHEALVRYSERGFKNVLLKPFTPTELIQALESAITD